MAHPEKTKIMAIPTIPEQTVVTLVRSTAPTGMPDSSLT
jgi:hypothetical protein